MHWDWIYFWTTNNVKWKGPKKEKILPTPGFKLQVTQCLVGFTLSSPPWGMDFLLSINALHWRSTTTCAPALALGLPNLYLENLNNAHDPTNLGLTLQQRQHCQLLLLWLQSTFQLRHFVLLLPTIRNKVLSRALVAIYGCQLISSKF